MIDFRKKLFKTYNKKLKRLHKENYKVPTNNLSYFITYLEFIRDYYYLSGNFSTEELQSLKIQFLDRAILEYHLSNTCIYKYYQPSNNFLIPKVGYSSETAQQEYTKEHRFHWELF